LTSLLNHLFGNITSRKCGPPKVLLVDEKASFVEWVFGMHESNMSISLHQLKLKVAKLTWTCARPFNNGILGTSWWCWFKQRHLKNPFD
jgi:hypothetical protein